VADEWYLFDGARQLGPLGLAELKSLLRIGQSGVLVWRDGLTGWVAPADVPELSAPSKPPPVPVIPHDRTIPVDQAATPAASDTATDPPRTNRFNFIARNWRGEYPIAVTYWGFGVLSSVLVGIVAALATFVFRAGVGYEPWPIFLSTVSMWVATLAISTWQTIGVWRSANRHIMQRGRLNKSSPWAWLAKLAVLLGALQVIRIFLVAGWPQLVETGRMSFLGDPDVAAYSIRVMRNGTEAEIAGGFKYGLTNDFSRTLDASPEIRIVHLDSLGGRIGEAEKLNKLIKDKKLDTYVATKCLSACTLAFAGGTRRILRQGAVLGFHAPTFPGISASELADATRDQRDIFLAAGFDGKFIDQALATPNSQLWKPTPDILLQAGVITSLADGTDYALSGVGGSITKEALAKLLVQSHPLLESLKVKYPGDYDAVVQAYYDGFAGGRTGIDATAAGRALLETILKKLRPLAEDSVLAELSAVYADQYAALGARNPALCYQYAADAGRVAASDIPETLLERESDINKRVVETATSRAALDSAEAEKLRNKIRIILASKGVKRDQLDLLREGPPPPAKYADYCLAAAARFREIGKLPQAEAGILMRETLANH
jgi:GYF domain 2